MASGPGVGGGVPGQRLWARTSVRPPNGLELSCPAEAGNSPLLYVWPAGRASSTYRPARRVSISELLGGGNWGVRWVPRPVTYCSERRKMTR